jgi:hypothetical protein
MLGSTVYLEGGRTITVGKETDGVTLLEVTSPWLIRVKHKGKEYDVEIGQSPGDAIFRPLTPGSLPPGVTETEGGATTNATTDRSSPAPIVRPANTSGAAGGPSPAVASIPLPLNRAAVSRMSVAAAREAMAKVVAARGIEGLDPAIAQRLETEEQWLVEHLSSASQ